MCLSGSCWGKSVSEVPRSLAASFICLEIQVTVLVTPGTGCPFPFPCSWELVQNWVESGQRSSPGPHLTSVISQVEGDQEGRWVRRPGLGFAGTVLKLLTRLGTPRGIGGFSYLS